VTLIRPTHAVNPPSVSPVAHRAAGQPRLAVVLGSGGVRSIAGLGLLEALREAGLKPDLIVGCSAGAIFGAVAAAGHDPAEGLALAMRLWTAEITRTPQRLAVAKMVLPRIGGFDPDFALRDDRLVLDRLRQAFGQQTLESLPLPLRVTATDADTGETVELREGRVVDALRASIALPFMFSPKLIDGRRLTDGFLTNPLPVSAARDALTVVALGVEAPMPSRIDRPARLLARVTSTMTNSLMQARVAAARAEGMQLVTVIPKPHRRIGLFDTDAMPELVELGRQSAREALPAIYAALHAADRDAPASLVGAI
jgi:NTE family protein